MSFSDVDGAGDLYSTSSGAPERAAVVHAAALDPRPPVSTRPDTGAAVVVKERRPVSEDDNQATAATVKMMCDYIAAGIKDNVCKLWAGEAVQCYALGRTEPAMLVWGVFWMLKHCVKYVADEPRLFGLGEQDGRDLLTAPAVLVRQDEPKEDCDGFTMLACTLLAILGLKSYIVTVKADPKKPGRWSHVFALVDTGGGKLCALDGSHGLFPGWMIPAEHMFAFQVWDLSGKPISLALPSNSRMNGYVRRRGLGDACYDDAGNAVECMPGESPYPVLETPATFPGGPGTSSGGSGFNWNQLLNSLITNAAKVATVAEAPPGSYINPTTGLIATGPSGAIASQVTAGFTSYMPLILLGVLGFGLLSAFSGKKGRS